MNGDPGAAIPPPPVSPQIHVPPGAHLSYSISPSPAPTPSQQQHHARPGMAPRGVSHGANIMSDVWVGQPRKKLILCFDGTGNKFKGNSSDTNILKIFRMLDRSSGNQFHYYQPGIGTYITNGTLSRVHVGARFKSWVNKAMDAAIGTSFDQHVIGGYKFLMRFYSPGDDIYMFGFSRGAYTARFLAEMIDHVGIVAPGNEEMVLFAWKTFSNWQQRHDNSKQKVLYEYMRAFRETFARPARRVRFLGLFDTVNSVPRFEQAWLKRSSGFPYTARSTARVIRHAVGIDERRAKFRQDLVNKVDAASIARQRSWKDEKRSKKKKSKKRKSKLSLPSSSVNGLQSPGVTQRNSGANGHPLYGKRLQASSIPSAGASPAESMISLNIFLDQDSDSEDDDDLGQDVEEVWFPGAHADIGGGWDLPADEEPLSHGPLVWMVREARKAGVIFDKERMKEHNCWIDEFEEEEDSSSESCESLIQPQHQQTLNSSAGAQLPAIEVTGSPSTEQAFPEKPNQSPPDLHEAEAQAHPLHHPIRNWIRRRHQQVETHKYPPKEFLERSYTRGKIHDCLLFNHGLDHIGVLGWKAMEYLPFRRMDLQSDGSWKAITWPLPRGEVRDMPENAKIHISVVKRMQADPTYRPGNLLVGGGGRGMRVAPPDRGTGDWVVLREEGNLIGEVLMKRSAWEKLTRKQKEELRGHRHRLMHASEMRDEEKQLF